jgi:ABC-type multidrug transport system fused ATPase/permease subunit
MKQEPSSRPEAEPPAAWPTQGDLKVTELSVKYSEDGPEVLNKISFEIKSGERVGIDGRTGAGKSSLALSLLRFTEISNGSIIINGLDVQKINLEALRQRITIIPQDPILFSGTIRTNLDPFGGLDDTELQAALDGSGLAGDNVDGVDSGIASAATSGTATPTETESGSAPNSKRIGLDTQITSGGGNLSQGQRQLLAFARALIRRSKLVIFDEATSSTDLKTDERIQETIRTSFPDSTLITIAHRLRTVMSFDRIIVLDNLGNGGEIVEFDTPFNLLQNSEGMLYNLARKSGEFEELLKLAKGRD